MAGARTSAQARAATTAPPLMPGLVWPAFTPLTSAALGEQAITPADSNLPAALTQASSPREPSARREEAEVSPHAETGADESLRLSSTVPEMKAEPVRQERLSGLGERVGFEPGPVIRAPKGLKAHSTPSPAPLNIEMPPPLPIAHTTPVLAEGAVSPALPSQLIEQPRETGETQLARAESSATASVQASSPQSGSEPMASELQLQPTEKFERRVETYEEPLKHAIASDTRSAVQARTPTVRPLPLRAAVPATVPAASPVESDADGPGRRVSAPTQPMKQESAFQAAVRPLPERLATPPTVPAASGGRQNRITIGRIDVQVNNHPPVQASAPPSRLAAPLPSDVLEARFLNRFWMKP